MSPTLTPETASPAATTSPTYSWPMVKPGSICTRPWKMCRSLPHTPVAVMRTMASSGASRSGSGLSTTATSYGAWKATACMGQAPYRDSGSDHDLEAHRQRQLLGAAHDAELDRRRAGVDRVVQRVEAVVLRAVDRDDQVAAAQPGAVGGRAVLDAAHEQAVALRQADRATHAAGDVRGGERDAQAARLVAGRVGQALDRGAGERHGEDQPAVEAHGVEADDAAVGVGERAARRAAGERRGVLD